MEKADHRSSPRCNSSLLEAYVHRGLDTGEFESAVEHDADLLV